METQATQAALDALEELRENKRRAKHFDALVEALEQLLALELDVDNPVREAAEDKARAVLDAAKATA